MAFFNLLGVQGVVVGVALAIGFRWVCIQLGVPETGSLDAIVISVATFVMAVYGLFVDRCDRDGLWQSYRVNVLQFIYDATGHPPRHGIGWNPLRRLAVFVVPLAWMPILAFVVSTGLIIAIQINGEHKFDMSVVVVALVSQLVTIALTWVVAVMTAGRRLIGGEVHAVGPPPSTVVGKVGAAIVAGQSPENPTRKAPAIVLGIAIFSLMGSLAFDARDPRRWLIVLVAPAIIILGVAALVDPRLFWALRNEGRGYPKRVRVLAGFLFALGLLLGASLALFLGAA